MKSTNFLQLIMVLLIFSFGITACKQVSTNKGNDELEQNSQKERTDKELGLLVDLMTGSFSNQEQAKADTNYYHISLEMQPIWTDMDVEGDWIYVEQALASKLDEPYRQRIYHLTVDHGRKYKSEIYLIPNEDRFVGGHKNVDAFKNIKPEMLELKDGCAVFLDMVGDGFLGGTVGKECLSTLRGSTYATSQVHIYGNTIASWDRGFDADDKHVWGATEGAYIFKK